MKNAKFDILMDRTFDASCMKRIGEDEWASQIITKLKLTYPKDLGLINSYYDFYLKCPDAEYIQYRQQYMIENRNKLKLRYK